MINKRKVTVSMLAKMCGISNATVSRVLNNNRAVNKETRKKVFEAIAKTGYEYKKANLTSPNGNVATTSKALAFSQVTVICDNFSMASAYDDYVDTTLRSIRDEAEHVNVTCDFCGQEEIYDQEKFQQILDHSQALILFGLNNFDMYHKVKQSGLPAVIINGLDPFMEISSVSPDNEIGMFNLGNYLIDHGHTHACLIIPLIRHSFMQRASGFRRAFFFKGIPFDENKQIIDLYKISTFVDSSQQLAKNYKDLKSQQDCYIKILMPYLLENHYFDDITAIACINDPTAISLIESLQENGYKVPDDFSVIGFDNIARSSVTRPSLSSMNTKYNLIANNAFKILQQICEGKNEYTRILTKVDLKIRQSFKPLN